MTLRWMPGPFQSRRTLRALLLPTIFVLVVGSVTLARPETALAQDVVPTQPAQPPDQPIPSPDEQQPIEKPVAPEPPTAAPPPVPPATQTPPPAQVAPAPPPPAAAAPPALTNDDLRDAGYLPGYRTNKAFGLSPWSPLVGAQPGGLLPGYAAPIPGQEWTFQLHGFMSASGQFGINHRLEPDSGQSSTVLHALPQSIDEYASFVGTATQPGQWIALNTSYGNRDVTANVSLSTWNPTDSTTYYQIGTQAFVNNAYLSYNIPPIDKLRLHANVGYFYANYGALGQSGGFGMYQNAIAGGPRGVGEIVSGELPLTPTLNLIMEEGFMGNRNGKNPNGNTPAGAGANVDPLFPGSYVAHAHVGLVRPGEFLLRTELHYLYNWSQDERNQFPPGVPDNQVTRGIDEAHPQDSSLSVYSIEGSMTHSTWGHLSLAASHLSGHNVFPLKGLITFGGEGQQLAERWFGLDTGTGTLDVAGINYSASLGRILSQPIPFDSNGPDLTLNVGAIFATSHSANTLYDGRFRQKYGADVLYHVLSFFSAGLRVDRVVPSSKDAEETFHVVAARLVFKTDWGSRDTITLLYAKWFYGSDSHGEASSVTAPRLDDQLVSLNVNMWF